MLTAENDPKLLFITAWIGGTVLIVALILLAIKWTQHREQQRMLALRAAAIRLGLEFERTDTTGSCEYLRHFEVGNRGHSKQVRDLIAGSWSKEEILFCNYRYITGAGKHQQTHRQSILCVTLTPDVPNFVLAPESFFAKVGQTLFGMADIDFLMHPEFSQLYVLRGADEETIRTYFEAGLLDYFAERPGLSIQVLDGVCVFFRANKRCRPEELEPFLTAGLEIKAALQGQRPTA